MVRGIAAAVGCLAATAATAVAFQVTAPPQAAPPVFRGGIDLVPLAVSVLDRSGHPVADLKASDFLVLEDGASQPIVTFGAVNLPVPPAVPGSVAGAANAVASDVATNAPHDGRVFLLVLDDMLIPNDPLMERTAKELARRVIDRLGPDDVMSVIFTRDNRHAQDFTTDKARLYAAVEEFSAGTAYISGGPSSYQLGSSISVISRAAEALAAIPQRRKALVYISEGAAVDLDLAVQPTPAGAEHARLIDEMNETLRRAERANVAVYGFVPSPDGTEGPLTRMYLSTGMDAIAAQLAAHKQATLTDDFLLSNASNTNGRAVLHSTDAPAGIDRMFEEMSVYYVLGYRSSNSKPDTYRRVQVKITRPGSYRCAHDRPVLRREGRQALRDAALGGRDGDVGHPPGRDDSLAPQRRRVRGEGRENRERRNRDGRSPVRAARRRHAARRRRGARVHARGRIARRTWRKS